MPDGDERGAPGGRAWRAVTVENWQDFFMVLRGILAELPPDVQLLLRPERDDRIAHITARPIPWVEVTAGEQQLVSRRCSSLTDVIERVRANVDDHWELLDPAQLSFTYEGQVSPRLRDAFTSDALVADLPEVDGPDDTAHSTGEDGRDDVAGRLDAETLERLRRLRDP